MRSTNSWVRTVLLGVTVASAQGCMLVAGAAVGVGGYAYVTGALEQNVDAHYAELHGAALDALRQDIGAMIVSEDLGQEGSEINAKHPDGRHIKITIESLTLKASKIKIRLGTFGDEAESLRIERAIAARI
ncbi:MAG: DUF3568 family protein [Candidatus Omnitrophica bacterium]|nr:DUF3568 family protein [Candidatus Omnitrophota bacterium]